MTVEEFDQFYGIFVGKAVELVRTKGREYSGTYDRFSNFNRIANRSNSRLTRLQVAEVFMSKHLDAIDNYIFEGESHSTETIESRFLDAVNYLILIAGMIYEDKLACEIIGKREKL
jgi:hypothetical protein